MKQISLLLAAAMLILLPSSGLATGPGAPPTNVPALLNTWTFENTTNWLATESGSLPMSATNLFATDLGDHYAVVVDHTNAAWLQYPVVESGGHTNLSVRKGSLCLWFAPSWASGNGPGDWGALIHAGKYTTNSSWGYWSLYCDPHGTNLYFSVQTNGAEATYLSAPISWTTNYWHFLALTYSATNTTLYLDGVAVTNGGGLTYLPGADALTNGFFLGSDEQGGGQARGRFDDVFTYDAPLDEGNVAALFNIFSIIYYGNPENPANFVSAPSTISYDPVFNAITGAGYLHQVSTNSTGCITSSNVWFTNMTASIVGTQGVSVTFTIAGGSNGLKYDVFGSPGLATPFTNAPWVWLGQGNHCTTYQITNLPKAGAVLVLGKPTDSDSDGLTDAYEALLAHSDPLNPDSDGSGLPDWWQIVNFGHLGVDPYGDPDGDGWNNLQEMQNGTDAKSFTSPPAPPRNVTARLDPSGSNVIIRWSSGGGTVASYAVEAAYVYSAMNSTSIVSSTTFSVTNAPSMGFDGFYDGPSFRVRANFSNGEVSYSDYVSIYSAQLDPWQGYFFPAGTNGDVFVALQRFPAGAQRLKIYSDYTYDEVFEVSVTNVVDGMMKLPASVIPTLEYSALWSGRFFGANGEIGTVFPIEDYVTDNGYPRLNLETNFINAARQMKENLVFLLRAGTALEPFSYFCNSYDDRDDYFQRAPASTNYEYYGFHHYSDYWGDSVAELRRPVQENYLFRNLAFSDADLVNGTFDTGQDANTTFGYGFRVLTYPKYEYGGTGYELPLPLAMGLTNSEWIYTCPFLFNDGQISQIGLSTSTSGLSLASNARNVFGLRFLSAHYIGDIETNYVTLEAGSTGDSYNSSIFMETEGPQLQLTNFYFVSQTAHFRYGAPLPAFPGAPDFHPTNSSPLLLTSVGVPIQVSGWARYAISNGYAGKFAFLEQYWDKAYKVNADGVATTNQTGLLSPYGDFFPTEGGRAALMTMPDIISGQRGTAIVYVVQLRVDANHDGTMDGNVGGEDITTFSKPMKFWVNNDSDWNSAGFDPVGKEFEVSLSHPPDFTSARMNSQRDLEDYARIWLCGLPAFATNSGYHVSMSWSYVTAGSPAINMVDATETNGGSLYLSDTNAAASQLFSGGLYRLKYPTISSSQGLDLPGSLLTSTGTKFFLFEGRSLGSGQLLMTISQNGSNVVQAGVWLDFHDVGDFYEQANITNNLNGAVSNWTSGISFFRPAEATQTIEDTNVFVYVHGGANDFASWQMRSQSIFKRMYWAGYYGRMASVQWPSPPKAGLLTNPSGWFNRSELIAYKASSAFSIYLNELRGRFPSYRLNLFPQSLGGAVVSEAAKGGAPFDTLILCQTSLAASCYDVGAPTNADLLACEVGESITPDWQPNGYHGVYTNISTGRIVSYYNTNDDFLNLWTFNQKISKTGFGYSYDGTNCWHSDVFGPTLLVTDSQEARAMLARSRTLAIGEQGPLGSQAAQGVIGTSVDLRTQFSFGNSADEHSAFFTRPIQTIWPFYDRILEDCLIPRIQR